MTLEEFVQQSLTQIHNGVAKARVGNTQIGVIINANDNPKIGFRSPGDQVGFLVDFDVAVTVSEKTGNEVGAGIQIANLLSGGGKKTTDSETASVSRICFSVPIVY